MQEKDTDSSMVKMEKDVFVHRSVVPTGTFLNEGDKVEYEIEDAEKGPQATSIKKL